MKPRKPSAALGRVYDDAESMLTHVRLCTLALYDASDESAKWMARITRPQGGYRGMNYWEVKAVENQVAHWRMHLAGDVTWMLRDFAAFRDQYKEVADEVASLYPIEAPPLRYWDVVAVSALDGLYQVCWQSIYGLFSYDRAVVDQVKDISITDREAEHRLADKMFKHYPGHFYRRWAGRAPEPFALLEGGLRRERLRITGHDPGSVQRDDELPDVSSAGEPTKPTEPMSISARAKHLGLGRGVFRQSIAGSRCRFRRISASLWVFCDDETRPAKPKPDDPSKAKRKET
jgi:hypothetical protein